jgi:hypothetical protein
LALTSTSPKRFQPMLATGKIISYSYVEVPRALERIESDAVLIGAPVARCAVSLGLRPEKRAEAVVGEEEQPQGDA